jgi:hypothetical protein
VKLRPAIKYKPVPLDVKIKQFHSELEAFLHDRSVVLPKGTGLPLGIIRQMMDAGSNCLCRIALKDLRKQEEDKKIVSRQSQPAV